MASITVYAHGKGYTGESGPFYKLLQDAITLIKSGFGEYAVVGPFNDDFVTVRQNFGRVTTTWLSDDKPYDGS